MMAGKIFENDKIILRENKTERDLTKQMLDFSNEYVKNLGQIQGCIFRGKSPTCGVKDVKLYSSMKPGQSYSKTNGLFSQTIINYYGILPVIDDGRLNDFNIREHFLSKIFLLAKYDNISNVNSLKELQEFHHYNKMLLMSFYQIGLKRLGKIIDNSKQEDIVETLSLYRDMLLKSTSRMPSVKSKINVFLHFFGQISEYLNNQEKAFILDTVEQYRNGRIPFSSLLIILKVYGVKYALTEVLDQSFLHPFPEQLNQVRDSGKQII